MNFNKIGVIIGREYAIRVKKKSFLFTTFLTPVLMGLLMALPTLIMVFGSDTSKDQRVAVVDGSGFVMPYLQSDEKMEFEDYTGTDPETLKPNLDSLGLKACIVISAADSSYAVTLSSYSNKPLSPEISGRVEDAVSKAVETKRVASYGIDGLEDIINSISFNPEMVSYTIGEDGSEAVTVTEIYRIISMVLSMLIYLFVYSFGAMVMSAVINEKTSRVVEVMVSSVKATELMIGKILGIAAVAMTQFLLWIVLTIAIFFAVQAIGLGKFMNDPEVASQMAGMAGGTDMASMTEMLSETSPELASLMSTLSQIDFVTVIGSFLLFFVFGYLLYASMFAAIGSAVDNEADTQQLLIPVTIPILAGFFISFAGFDNPDNSLLMWASYIPFTSPICMMTRIVNGVAAWELWLSLGLLVLTTFFMMYLSAKIYRVGILMFGKKSSFKDMWNWLRYK